MSSSYRQSFFTCNINTLLTSSIRNENEMVYLFNQQVNAPVTYIKIYGTVLSKVVDSKLSKFIIEDGTGSIKVLFNNLGIGSKINKWNFVRVIGSIQIDEIKTNEYEIYIVADTIKNVSDPRWELVHIKESKKSLNTKRSSKIPANQKPTFSESDSTYPTESKDSTNKGIDNSPDPLVKQLDNLTQKIESLLKTLDNGDGVEFSHLLSELGQSVDESAVDDILFELAYEGKVYQPRPDYYKIMD